MSADNWSVCPQCTQTKAEEKLAAKKKADRAYGKVSAEEWKALCNLADAKIEHVESLREDYEIGITEQGQFYVSYHGACEDCNFEFRFSHEAQTPMAARAAQ